MIPLGPGNEIVSPMATSLAKRPAFTAAGKPGRRNHVVVRAQQASALDVVSALLTGMLNLRCDDGTWRCICRVLRCTPCQPHMQHLTQLGSMPW